MIFLVDKLVIMRIMYVSVCEMYDKMVTALFLYIEKCSVCVSDVWKRIVCTIILLLLLLLLLKI